MALPFLKGLNSKRDQIIAVDLGSKVTKAVQMSRKGANYTLDRFALAEVPGENPGVYADVFADHLNLVLEAMDGRCKRLCVAIGVNDSLLRHAEMPMVPVSDMRSMLRYSSKNYLQQDLSDCVFDCHILPFRKGADDGDGRKPANKCRVLVGAAKRTLIDELQAGAKKAGLLADHVIPNFIGPANAFERAYPEPFAKEAVALVELGQKNTTITIMFEGELALSRVVNYGSERLTQGIADAMGISEEEAEGAKLTMPTDVESYLSALLMPLGREMRASIDFFDHQHDKAVSQAFFSGGSARSNKIIENLQIEMMVPCHQWDPLGSLQMNLPPEQLGEVEQVGPQLAVAVGAGLAALD
jgi:type IV pilus assembly protein PilM